MTLPLRPVGPLRFRRLWTARNVDAVAAGTDFYLVLDRTGEVWVEGRDLLRQRWRPRGQTAVAVRGRGVVLRTASCRGPLCS